MPTKAFSWLASAGADDLADAWIALWAGAGEALLVLHPDDAVGTRAILHVAAGAQDPLGPASRRFLGKVLAYEPNRKRARTWFELARTRLEQQGARGGAARVDRVLRSLLKEEKHPAAVEEVDLVALSSALTSLLSVLPEERLLETAADLASRHPGLHGQVEQLRARLSLEALRSTIVEGVAGGPRDVRGVDDVLEATLAGQALGRIWQEPMLEPAAAAVALGAQPTNREKVRQYRERSWLLGLPRDRGSLYPSFQFDLARKDVEAHAREVNRLLGAREDPWGVASWWVSSNDLLEAVPRDLLGTDRAGEVVRAAQSLREPVG